MSLSIEQVRHIARLASIELSEEELEKTRAELNDILAYVEKLQGVSTTGVVPTSHVHGETNAFRNDVVRESLPREAVEGNAPDFAEGGFRVPKII